MHILNDRCAGRLQVVAAGIKASEMRLAVRSSFDEKAMRTWQLSRMALFSPYALEIWFKDWAIK